MLNPHETLSVADRLEQALRRLSALTVRAAGDVEQKNIAAHVGARSTVSLLQQRLRISPSEAKRRLLLAADFHPGTSLTGEQISPAWPAAAEAFREGRINGDHARVLSQSLAVISDKARALSREARLAEATGDRPGTPDDDASGPGASGGDAPVGYLPEGGAPPEDGVSGDGPYRAEDVSAAAERHLLRQALDFDPAFVERCGRRWIDHLDPDGRQPTEAETVQYHGLFFGRPRKSGLVPFRGAMTQEQQETLLTAIQPATNPRHRGGGVADDARPADVRPVDTDPGVVDSGGAGPGVVGPGGAGPGGTAQKSGSGDNVRDLDSRTHQHKLLDALIGLAIAALKAGSVHANGSAATVLVTIDHRALLGQLTGSGALAHTGPVSPAAVRRMACDANIIPVVLGGAGQILDVGRRRRLFTTHQRRAIIARDQGCVFPGCTAPPSWCACHHIDFYSRGGPTSVGNGCLLCEHHHGVIHQEQWQITMRHGRPWLIPPRWVDPEQRPRLNHYHHPPPFGTVAA